MLRLSTLIAALILLASVTTAASPAQAVVCSYDHCVSRCFTAGGKYCLRLRSKDRTAHDVRSLPLVPKRLVAGSAGWV